MATYSSILAWKIAWTEEPGGLQFMGSQRVGLNCAQHSSMQLGGSSDQGHGSESPET